MLTGPMIQDDDGFLWIGSQGSGLFKYDGYSIKKYLSGPEGLCDDNVWMLYKDKEGLIWIATAGGLNCYNKKTDTFVSYKHDPQNPHSISSNSFNVALQTIIEDRNGNIWIGAQNGLNLFHKKNMAFTRFQNNPSEPNSLNNNSIFSIYEDRHGVIWIGDQSGLNKYSSQTNSFTRYTHNPSNSNTITRGIVYAIHEDKEGGFWVGTEQGLNKFDRENETFLRFEHNPENPNSLPNNFIYKIYEDEKNRLWFVHLFKGGGLTLLNKEDQTFIRYQSNLKDPETLSADTVANIFKDSSGILWFPNVSGAVDKHDKHSSKFYQFRHDPENPKSISDTLINTSYEDKDGTIWFGANNGLNRYHRRTGTFTRYLSNPDDPTCIPGAFVCGPLEDRDGNFWVLSAKYITLFDRNKGQALANYKTIGTPISVIEDNKDSNVLWIVSFGDGLGRFDKTSFRTDIFSHNPDDPDSIGNNCMAQLYQDSDGKLWLPTFGGGLNIFDPLTNKVVKRYKHNPDDPTTIGSDTVAHVFEDSAHQFWIGTYGGGLNKFDPVKETFRRYNIDTGFPSNTVTNILEDDDGNLWLGSKIGYLRFNPKTETVRVYTIGDGLAGDEFQEAALCKSRDGMIWIGTITGANCFHPRELNDNPFCPPIKILSIKCGGLDLKELGTVPERVKKLHLDWRHNFFEFEYTALNFTRSERNQFKYKLDGLDLEWYTPGTRRFGQYTNIPGGDYTLQVIGSNNDDLWNTAGTSLKIFVDSPPWKTWWAYSLYGLLLAGILFTYTRIQIQKLTQARLMNERLRQVDRLKDEFLANTSHELRTPLTGIIGLAESLLDGVAGDLSNRMKHNLSMIATSGRRLTNLVNDILDFSKLKHKDLQLQIQPLDIRTIVDLVMTLSEPLIGNKKVKMVNNIDPHIPAVDADENRIQQVLYNLIGNSVKFTEQGTITCTAAVRENSLSISISDTGIGVPEEKLFSIFAPFEQADGSTARRYGGTGLGLAVSKQLVELHGGKIWAESQAEKGTTFTFTLPISKSRVGHEHSSAIIAKTIEHVSSTGAVEEKSDKHSPDKKEHVLIVDDEPVNLQVLKNHLSMRHYQVTIADSGAEALSKLEPNHGIDLVLLDIMMPGMTGFEACRRIREKFPQSQLPIIMVTAKNRVEDLVAGFESGANDFLPKPFSKGELLARVETQLNIKSLIEGREKMEEQLRHSQKMEALGVLTGGIAHDFNNILSSIIGYAEIVQEILPKGSPAWIDQEQVIKAGNRAADLVSYMLTFSRKTEGVKAPIDISLIIKEALKLLKASTPSTIDIKLDRQAGAYIIEADPTQIHQILMNICTNAVHAMEDVGGIMKVSLSNVDLTVNDLVSRPDLKPGPFARLSVKDNGKGMDPSIIDQVFDPFFTTKAAGKGTGMGLSVVHGIVESHGGIIRVTSELNIGSEFLIFLPLSDKDARAIDKKSPDPHLGNERILVVDDEEPIAGMIKIMLERLGYKVTKTSRSLEALDIFQAQPFDFDLVITDQTMPLLTGAELAKAILKIRPDVPIILCSGYSSAVSEDKAKVIGVKAFATKPLDRSDLARIVRQVLDEA